MRCTTISPELSKSRLGLFVLSSLFTLHSILCGSSSIILSAPSSYVCLSSVRSEYDLKFPRPLHPVYFSQHLVNAVVHSSYLPLLSRSLSTSPLRVSALLQSNRAFCFPRAHTFACAVSSFLVAVLHSNFFADVCIYLSF